MAVLLLLPLGMTQQTIDSLDQVTICDELFGTALVADQVSLCHDNNDADLLPNNLLLVVDSIDTLRAANRPPQRIEEVTFLYEPPPAGEPKTVRMVLTLDLIQLRKRELGEFAQNMLAGNGLMLTVGGVGGEYYLLSYPAGQELFSPTQMILTHIPLETQYVPQQYPGTNWWIFDVLGDRRIAVGIFGSEVHFSTLEPGEVPAAYVTPWNLDEQLEVRFSQLQPVEITAPANLGTFTVCQQDNAQDLQVVLVCRNNDEQFTFNRSQLTRRSMRPAGVSSPPLQNFAFLYEVVPNEAGESIKQVSMFRLNTLSQTITNLDYNNFINAMMNGRRAAFSFDNRLFLLGHEEVPVFSLPDLELREYDGDKHTPLFAAGSEDRVEFPTLAGGKIFFRRNYGTPPPPFQATALHQEELTPINLEEELFTSFSSTGKITISPVPNLGTIMASATDIGLYQPTFKITLGQGTVGQGQHNLPFQQPYEDEIDISNDNLLLNRVLIYYDSASLQGAAPVKTANMYYLYDLTPSFGQTGTFDFHPFNDQFISMITSGRELALRFGSPGINSYYLLTHQGNPGQVQFFDPAKLKLRKLGTKEFFPVTVQDEIASFTVPEGRIEVQANANSNLIFFRSTTQEELELETMSGEAYSIVLTTSNRVLIGNDAEFLLCNQELYQFVPAADVCFSDQHFVVASTEEPVFQDFGEQSLFFEVNGQTGENKQVTIRRVLPLQATPATPILLENWNEFIQHLLANDLPVLRINANSVNNRFYLPQAANNLLSGFSLREQPVGEIVSTRNLQALGPVTARGDIVVNDTIVHLQQALDQTEPTAQRVETLFTLEQFRFVPENGEELAVTMLAPVDFRTTIEGQTYRLTLARGGNTIVELALTDRVGQTIMERWFAAGDKKTILLDGVSVEIEVEGIGAGGNTAQVSLRRLNVLQ